MDDIDAELAKPRLIQSALSWSATTTIDCSLARAFTGTNTQVTTIAFSNVPTSTFFTRLWLKITNGAAFAITWPASVVWENGDVDPVLTASGVDIIGLITYDGGTTWYGSVLHQKAFVIGGDLQQNGKVVSRIGGSTGTNRVAHTIFTAANRTTTSTTLTAVASYTLPAASLDRNGAGLYITYSGLVGATDTLVTLVWGATTLASFTVLAGNRFFLQAWVIRRATSSQRVDMLLVNNAAVSQPVSANPTENEASAQGVTFGCDQTGAGTFTLQTATIVYLDPDTTSVS